MWAPGARSQGLEPREELGEEVGALPERDAEQVHDDVRLGVAESVQDLADVGRTHATAHGDDVVQRAVVALRVDDAELEAAGRSAAR